MATQSTLAQPMVSSMPCRPPPVCCAGPTTPKSVSEVGGLSAVYTFRFISGRSIILVIRRQAASCQRRRVMDQIEQETSRDDPAVEVTDLPSTEGKRNVVASLAGARSAHARPVNASPTGAKPVSASPASIWRNWPLVTAAGILLLLIVMVLPILPTILNQSGQHRSSTSAAIHATPTPILSPLSGGHSVYPTLAHGIIYIGASDGAITAVRASDGKLLWQYKTSGAAYAPLVINGVIYGEVFANPGPNHVDAWRVGDGSLLWQSSDHLAILDTIDGIVYAALDNNFEALQASTGAVLL